MPESIFKPSRKNTFAFEGHAVVTDNSFSINKTNNEGTWVYNSLNFGIDCGEHGINYASMMGGYNPKGGSYIPIQKIGEDGTILSREHNINVNWEDRLSFNIEAEENINKSSFIDISVEKGSDGKLIQRTFISAYDAVEYLKEQLVDKLPIVVRGHIDYRLNDAEDWIPTHVIDNITLKSEEFLQPKTVLNLMVLVDENTLGQPNIEEKNVPLYVKTAYYVNKINKTVYKQTCAIPFKILFDINSIDLNDEREKKKFKYGCEHYFKAEKGFVTEVLFRCHYSGGVKKAEIKLEDLSSDIRDGIEAGFINPDQVLGQMISQTSTSKDIIFEQVMTRVQTVKDDDGSENSILKVVIEKNKYKNNEIVLFEDLEPVDAQLTSAPVDNTLQINDEEIDKSASDIMALFSSMGQ